MIFTEKHSEREAARVSVWRGENRPEISKLHRSRKSRPRILQEAAAKLVDLLNRFGFAESGFKESDFTQPEHLIQLGGVPNRIDLLTSITGVTTDEVFVSKVTAELDGIPVFILSKDALIRNKRAIGRPQDTADLSTLEG